MNIDGQALLWIVALATLPYVLVAMLGVAMSGLKDVSEAPFRILLWPNYLSGSVGDRQSLSLRGCVVNLAGWGLALWVIRLAIC